MDFGDKKSDFKIFRIRVNIYINLPKTYLKTKKQYYPYILIFN